MNDTPEKALSELGDSKISGLGIKHYLGLYEIGLFTIVIVALLIRIWDLGGRTAHYDEAIHLHFAWKLAESDGAILGWPWIFGTDYIHSPWMHGPFQIELTALIFKIFGDTDVTARLGYVFFGTALVAIPYFFRDYLGRTGSLLAAILLSLSPTLLYFSRFGRNDIIMAFFATALMILMWRFIQEGHRRYLYLASAVLAFMFATKETAYLIVAVFGLISLVLVAVELRSRSGRSGLSQVGRPTVFLLLLTTITLPQWSAISGIVQGIFNLTLVNPDPQTGKNIPNVDGTIGLVGAPAWEGKTLLLPVLELPIVAHIVVVIICLALLSWLVHRATLSNRSVSCLLVGPLAVTAGVSIFLFRPLAGILEAQGMQVLDLVLGILFIAAALAASGYHRYPLHQSMLLFAVPGILTAFYAFLFTPVVNLQAIVNGILPDEVTIGSVANGLPTNYVVALCILSITIVISVVIGVRWLGRAWLVCAGIFYLVWSALYTTLFTNMSGLFSGSWQGMGYWIAQQEVARGNQPWYYYFVGLPVYELFPVVFGIAGTIYFLKTRDQLGIALTIWAATTFLVYTVASEKMPWLLVNITLPLIVLSAKFLGDLTKSIQWSDSLRLRGGYLLFLAPLAVIGSVFVVYAFTGQRHGQVGLAAQHWVVFSGTILTLLAAAYLVRITSSANGSTFAVIGIGFLLLSFGTWSAFRASYTFDDSNREILVYAQGGYDLQKTYTSLETILAQRSNDTENYFTERREVEVDYDIWYPFQWYARNMESDGQLRFTCFKDKEDPGWNPSCNSLDSKPESGEFRPSSLIIASNHTDSLDEELADYEKTGPFHSLLWYPETYRRPSESRQDEEWKDEFRMDLKFFQNTVTSKDAWHSILSYWIFRDLDKDWFTGDYYSFSR